MESSQSSQRKRDRFLKRFGRKTRKPDDQNASEDATALRPNISSADTTKLDPVDTAAVKSETSEVVSDALWAEAYELCKLRESDLVDRYEQHMKAYTSSAGTAREDHFSPGKIAELIKAQRGTLDAQRLTLSLRGRSVAIREQGEKIVKFVLFFNSTISSALASQPYASLAWSGVSIILPLLLNPSKQSQKMMDGLETLSNLMTRCHVREELFPKERISPHGETTDAYNDLRNASVELYSFIFEYQARCVCHLSRRSVKRAREDMFETNDWAGMLDKIDNADKKCAGIIALFDKSKEHTLQERQAEELTHQTEMFETFQKRYLEIRQYDLEANLLTSLASDYESDKASIARRVDRTCEWFFQDERFRRWRDNESSSLLWISAGPGCGKSVLARTLIDEDRLSATSALHTTTCYFFFREGEGQRTKATNAFSAILHQLFDQNPQLIGNALPSSKSFGAKLGETFSELWKVLTKTAEDENAGHVFCVLDALDECEALSIQTVIDKIIDYYGNLSQRRPSAVLKFLVTSRPYSRFRSAFEHLQGVNEYVHFDGDERSNDISNEINLVIDDKVPRLTQNFANRDCERISRRLKGMKNRTYLWLSLTLNIIEREPGIYSKASKIEKLLSDLPVDVSAAYERILDQSSEKERKSARILLQVIIAAFRPLALAEANVAMAMATRNEEVFSLDELDLWPEERFKSTVQDMCGLFVSVHDGKLSLIHQTARDFLLRTGTDEPNEHFPEDKKWSRCFAMPDAQEVLCSICVDEVTLDTNASSRVPAFFRYAARHWVAHYINAPRQKGGTLQKRAAALCKPGNYWLMLAYLLKPMYMEMYNADASNWSPIGIASVLNLAGVVQHLLAGVTEVDQRAGTFGTAIRVAIKMERLEILRLLCQFNTGARFAQDPRSDVSALQYSNAEVSRDTDPLLQDVSKLRISKDLAYAMSGPSSPKVIRILLEHGADPNFRDDAGETLLSKTLFSREDALRHLMIQDPELARRKETGDAQLLLEFGADPNLPSKANITPLQMASGPHCNPVAVQLLLKAGAHVNIPSPAGETPIFLANKTLRAARRDPFARSAVDMVEVIRILRDAGAKEDIEEASNFEDISDLGNSSDLFCVSDFNEASDNEAFYHSEENSDPDVVFNWLEYSSLSEISDGKEVSDSEATIPPPALNCPHL